MNLASYIDHTLLKPDASMDEIERLCQEALRYGFYSICVNSFWIPYGKTWLKNSPVRITTTIGFPLGASSAAVKLAEAKIAIELGADELDLVINIGALKSGLVNEVADELRAVAQLKAEKAFTFKVILETTLLSYEEKIRAAEMAIASGADFLKTSTGFAPGGVTLEDVKLLKNLGGPTVQVKASGGIRDRETALKMIEAGATRLGTSQSVALVSHGQSPSSPSPY